MDVILCDRCEKQTDDAVTYFMKASQGAGFATVFGKADKYALCQDCKAAFKKFVKGKV